MDPSEPLWTIQREYGYVNVPRALIGISGDSVSVMIDRSQLGRGAPFAAFRWEVHASADDVPGTEAVDCVPKRGQVGYPPGTAVTDAPGGACF